MNGDRSERLALGEDEHACRRWPDAAPARGGLRGSQRGNWPGVGPDVAPEELRDAARRRSIRLVDSRQDCRAASGTGSKAVAGTLERRALLKVRCSSPWTRHRASRASQRYSRPRELVSNCEALQNATWCFSPVLSNSGWRRFSDAGDPADRLMRTPTHQRG